MESLKEILSRRRALVITPFAFAGIYALTSRKGDPPPPAVDVTIIPFDDHGNPQPATKTKRIVHTDAEWKKLLTPGQFYVTRRESTDTPYTGTMYKSHNRGLFRCICCSNAVFSSDAKFDSATGWPSFFAPIAKENIATRRDTSMMMDRIEVHCTLCLAHLGHVFDDGPEPTGLRYCINESSLRFVAL
ncbi:MAG: peptide-methionine (R)-S-oxide reductase MsrB [Acidobacteriia bacterium]|nr:peptide-methionine (R)-S-oxide reductase MsrB [Terriglobia bacterium]